MNKGSRRRRGVPSLESNPTDRLKVIEKKNSDDYDDDNDQEATEGILSNGDYYDDGSNGNGDDVDRMYNDACSFGQFALNPCLCMLQSAYVCCRRMIRRYHLFRNAPRRGDKKVHSSSFQSLFWKRWDWVDWLLLLGIATSGSVFFYCLSPSPFTWVSQHHTWFYGQPFLGRPVNNHHLDNMPILIKSFDFADHPDLDLGGWLFGRQFYQPTIELNQTFPDRGGFLFRATFGQPRTIQPDDAVTAAQHWLAVHRDNAKDVSERHMYNEELDDVESDCQRQSWLLDYQPTCNEIHVVDMTYNYNADREGLGDDQLYDIFLINNGYYRDVWVIHEVQRRFKSVLKTIRWKHKLKTGTLFTVLRDALIMERLTHSPRIIDIWGHCGTAVWVEAMPFEVEEVIVPGEGLIKQQDLHDELEVKPQNDYTAEEKLDIAIAMAESLADLHGFKDGLIVHDDVQLCQWLRNPQGKLKLGDFNRAEIPNFNPVTGQYCRWNNGRGNGNYRAPEEFDAKDLDEQIDVFTFGNNIYALLTGLWVFYEDEDDEIIHKKVIAGETSFVDPRYRTRSLIEGGLVDIMEKCWAYKAEDRPDIFEVVRLFKKIKTEYEKLPPSPKEMAN